jgi:hypothetical protein
MLKNNELKIAINNLKENQNQETETRFLNLLKDASFYVITETKINADTITSEMISNGEDFSLLLLNTSKGDGYFPLFTDENMLDNPNIPDNRVIIEFNNLFKILKDNELGKGIVINPFNESFIMTKEEIFTIFETKNNSLFLKTSVNASPEDLVAKLRNDELKSAIHNMKENPNKETESQFMEEFFKAKFIAPSAPQMDPMMVEELNKQGANISTMPQLLTVKLQDGGVYYPVYTDKEELMRNGEDVTVTVVTFAYYLKFFSDKSRIDGILINPYGDGFIMPRKVMNSLYNASKK